jgi:hypothetical protein
LADNDHSPTDMNMNVWLCRVLYWAIIPCGIYGLLLRRGKYGKVGKDLKSERKIFNSVMIIIVFDISIVLKQCKT